MAGVKNILTQIWCLHEHVWLDTFWFWAAFHQQLFMNPTDFIQVW